jgi:hypothetical protein
VSALVILAAAIDLTVAGSGRWMNRISLKTDPIVTPDSFEGSRETVERLRALVNRGAPQERFDVYKDSVAWPNAAPTLELPTAGGDDPLGLERYLAVRRLFAPGPIWVRRYEVSVLNSPALHLAGVRYLLAWSDGQPRIQHPDFPRVLELPGHDVFQNRKVLPRFFLVERVTKVRGINEALRFMSGPEFDPARVAAVESEVTLVTPGAGQVKVLEYGPRKVTLETTAAAANLLVTSETYYPGWRAWVDGQERPLVMTNGTFRGLPVPAGTHRVRMRFEPRILWYGFAISAMAWAGLGAAEFRRRRRTARSR